MYAVLDPEAAYCQSMNFVCGTLLMYAPPEVAFRVFAHLMGPLGFRRMYLPGLPLLMDCLDELGEQLARQLPRLDRHLQTFGVGPSLFATQWFMTFGLDQFPFGMALRLLDLLFYERTVMPLFRLALALLKKRQRALLAIRDSTEMMTALRRLPLDISDDKIEAFFSRDVAAQKPKLSRPHIFSPPAVAGNGGADPFPAQA